MILFDDNYKELLYDVDKSVGVLEGHGNLKLEFAMMEKIKRTTRLNESVLGSCPLSPWCGESVFMSKK
ncbi:hypothetical protein [Bartonella sp. B1099]|uniref:hypothetical protein n=1 Tax=Bartonella sp. B1099 TaxID=2911422 RepID=UPI0020C4F4AB|nr:hypothetical protein [Bartonella sp. B1099]